MIYVYMSEGQEIPQSPQRVENVDKAQEMAIAEDLVRDWGKRYQKFQENPQSETDREAIDWFNELKNREIAPDVFISYADRRADMVGELHDYEQQLDKMSKTQLEREIVRNTFGEPFSSPLIPRAEGVEKEGLPRGAGEEERFPKLAIDQAYRLNLHHWKTELALDKMRKM